MATPFALDRVLLPHLSGVGLTLVFPVAFVALEFLKSRIMPAATWGSIAYTQYGYLAVMQLAAVLGIWGITFAITWFASTIDVGLATQLRVEPGSNAARRLPRRAEHDRVGRRDSCGLCDDDSTAFRVATLNRPVDLFVPGEMTRITEGRVRPEDIPQTMVKLARLHDWFLDGSRREARAGAKLIAWPEANLLVFWRDEPAFLERARRVAAEERVYLAMGIASISPAPPSRFKTRWSSSVPQDRSS